MVVTETALITGATSGLGAEFARQLAARGYNIVLVGRDTARLDHRANEIAAAYPVRTEILTADLATWEGVATVSARLGSDTEPVTLLVNNAGFGLKGWFTENPVEDERNHLKVLVRAPMELSHAAVATMLRHGGGRIINVASVAGFTPRGTYSAAKAWVINFSRWANLFYSDRGVHVTAVCPGFVRTEFHQRMNADTSGIKPWMWLDPERVVREGLADAFAGRGVSIPSKRYKVMARVSSLVPDRVALRMARRGR